MCTGPPLAEERNTSSSVRGFWPRRHGGVARTWSLKARSSTKMGANISKSGERFKFGGSELVFSPNIEPLARSFVQIRVSAPIHDPPTTATASNVDCMSFEGPSGPRGRTRGVEMTTNAGSAPSMLNKCSHGAPRLPRTTFSQRARPITLLQTGRRTATAKLPPRMLAHYSREYVWGSFRAPVPKLGQLRSASFSFRPSSGREGRTGGSERSPRILARLGAGWGGGSAQTALAGFGLTEPGFGRDSVQPALGLRGRRPCRCRLWQRGVQPPESCGDIARRVTPASPLGNCPNVVEKLPQKRVGHQFRKESCPTVGPHRPHLANPGQLRPTSARTCQIWPTLASVSTTVSQALAKLDQTPPNLSKG